MATRVMSRERRQAPRAPERVAVAITDGGAALTAETNNLSATGAYCTLSKFIPPMTKLNLEFSVPNGGRNVPIRCAGVVVRVEPAVSPTLDRGAYHVAIFFTELSERQRGAIARFVRERLDASPTT